jgi:hypothetical protein
MAAELPALVVVGLAVGTLDAAVRVANTPDDHGFSRVLLVANALLLAGAIVLVGLLAALYEGQRHWHLVAGLWHGHGARPPANYGALFDEVIKGVVALFGLGLVRRGATGATVDEDSHVSPRGQRYETAVTGAGLLAAVAVTVLV